MKVFVISLKRAQNRRSYIREHLSALGLDFEILDAIDYRDRSQEALMQECDADAVRNDPSLSPGPIACMLSHLEAYKRIVADQLPMALIVEDDVALSPDIKTVLSKVEGALLPDEMISLAYRSNSGPVVLSSRQAVNFGDGSLLASPEDIRHIGLGLAYVVSRDVAQKLGRLAYPVHATADSWYKFHALGIYRSIRCYFPVSAKAAAGFNTTLDYAGTSALRNKVTEWIKSRRIPFVSAFFEKRHAALMDRIHRVEFRDCAPFNAEADPGAPAARRPS